MFGKTRIDSVAPSLPPTPPPAMRVFATLCAATALALAAPPALAQSFPSSDPPIAIPDNDPAGASSTIAVSGGPGTVTDLNVGLDVAHTWAGDLIFTVTSPAGTSVTIYDRPGVPATGSVGCSGNDPVVIADDEGADGSFEADCMSGANPAPAFADGGSYTPNEALSAFDGESSDGTWTLSFSDNAAQDTGTLVGWQLLFNDAPPVAVEPDALPAGYAFELRGANPFAAQTRFGLRVAETQPVRVVAYDAMGREVAVLLDATVAAASPETVRFERGALAAGTYVVRALGATFDVVQRVSVVR